MRVHTRIINMHVLRYAPRSRPVDDVNMHVDAERNMFVKT